MNLSSEIHKKNIELEIINEELCNVKKLLKRKENDLFILKERMKKSDKDIKKYEKNKKHIGDFAQIIIIIQKAIK